MAIFNVKISSGKKGTGKERYDYITREGKYKSKANEIVKIKDINLPDWAETGKDFFIAADIYERKNGTAFKQFIISLPTELTDEQNIKLADRLTEKILNNNKAGTYAIHQKPVLTRNMKNNHLHLIFSERIIKDPENIKPPQLFFRRYAENIPEEKRGYPKDIRFGHHGKEAKKIFKSVRQDIEDIINNAYKEAGLSIRVSSKTKKEQLKEAVKENNQEKIELLTIPVPQRLSAKHWNKIIKKWKNTKLINYDQAIPLLPETNSNSLNEIKNDDLSTYSLMLKQLNYQLRKIEIQIKYARLTKDKAQKKAEAKNTPVSGKPLQEILQGFTASLTETEQHNNKLILLATRIYGSTQNQTEVIYNVTTRGRYKKYSKAFQELQALNNYYNYLLKNNKITPGFSNEYNLKSKQLEETINTSKDKINQILTSEPGKKQQKNILNRLQKFYPKALQKVQTTQTINEKIKAIKKIAEELTQKITLNPSIEIPLSQLKKLNIDPTSNLEEIKKLVETINKTLPESNQKEPDKQNKKVQHISQIER